MVGSREMGSDPFVRHRDAHWNVMTGPRLTSGTLVDHPLTEHQRNETPSPPDSEQFPYTPTVKYGGQGSEDAADNRPTNGLSLAPDGVELGSPEGARCT